jgi:hypothetical protein
LTNIDRTWFFNRIDEFSEEGRDVELYGRYGQTIFPLYSADGSLFASMAVFPILRGSEPVPKFAGSFPTEDGATRELGNGWIVMCVHFPHFLEPHQKIAKLQEAEAKLLQMKSGG